MSSRSKKHGRRGSGPPGPPPDAGGPSVRPDPGESRTAGASRPGAKARKRARLAALATLLLAALLLMLRGALVHVHPGDRIFRLSVAGREAARLAPGWHVAIPLLQRLERVPAGEIRASGRIPVRSREGVALEVPYEVSAEIEDQRLAALLRDSAARAGPDEPLRTAAA